LVRTVLICVIPMSGNPLPLNLMLLSNLVELIPQVLVQDRLTIGPEPLFGVREYTGFDEVMQEGLRFLTHLVGVILADRGLEPHEEPSMHVLSATLRPFAVPAPAVGLQHPVARWQRGHCRKFIAVAG